MPRTEYITAIPPSEIDGEPDHVARVCAAQLRAVLDELHELVERSEAQAQNAHLTALLAHDASLEADAMTQHWLGTDTAGTYARLRGIVEAGQRVAVDLDGH